MIWLVLAIALWGLLHSWLASTGVKAAVRRAVGERAWRWYRFAYNALSVATFLPILLLAGLLPDRVLYVIKPPWLYLMLGAEALAILGLLVAVRQTDTWAFLGLKQAMGAEEEPGLVTGGLYRYMRHPMYFFSLLIIWLSPAMTLNLLVTFAGLSLYLLIGAYFEEKKLARVFGSTYAEYKARTPMIVPLPRRSAKRP